jgi:hypothetical protein
MGQWEKFRRKGGRMPDPTSLISIRRNQIALNAHYVATANLAEMSHVTIYADPELFRLGFKFDKKSPPDDDAIALTNDGGGRGRGRGRCIQVQALMREHVWLAEVANITEPKLRRFEPKWSATEGMWVISLCPPFEHRVSDRSNIPSGARGIYRYKRGDEIVYIGKGSIRSRLGAPERDQWDFETIEYSLLSDEKDQVKWEAFWLDRFFEVQGKLPIYNRILGTGSKK